MQHWNVLFSKPRKETQVCDQLAEEGIEAYLPLLPLLGGRRRSPRPLFPRYLFARLDGHPASPNSIKWLPGLTCVVSFGGEYAVVQDAVLDHIRRRLAERQERPPPRFRAGERVRLPADHPLSALDAVFEGSLSGGARARILLEFVGRLTRCEIDIDLLESADGPGWSR